MQSPPLHNSMKSMGNLTTILKLTLLLLLVTTLLLLTQGVFTAIEFMPARLTSGHRQVESGVDRRVLTPFQLCLDCRCCAANDPSNCSMMPCCFGIDCNLPDKPFGVCAFVPKTCNCTSCQ